MFLPDRRGQVLALRLSFVALVALAAWWSLRGQADEIAVALTSVPWWRLALSTGLVAVGLGVTGLLWRRVLAAHGGHVPLRAAAYIFFVGQLGKYVPGSVWSVGVHAAMTRTFGVAPRTTVSTSLTFLALHVATGLLLGGAALPWLDLGGEIGQVLQIALAGLCLAGGTVVLMPGVLRWTARRTLGLRIDWDASDSVRAAALMAVTWAFYAGALLPLLAQPGLDLLWPLAAAFALGYVVGVAVPVAPAGLGAREVVFLAVMTPALGVADAAALAVLARLVHTAADFLVAGLSWQVRHADQR